MALPQFIKPYVDGYENGEIGNTPVTAEILNTNYDGFLLNLNDWISGVDGDISELETAIGTIPSDLDDLSDIVITSPSDGQVLKYDNATGKWINGSGGSGGASSLNDLNDVTISNPANGQIVEYNSSTSKWENKNAPSIPDDLNDLTDVNISSPSDGQFLKYDNTSGKWKNASGGSGGADDLSDLGDVTISTPTDGQVLTYDDNSNKWINSDPTGGSGGHTIVNDSGTSLSQEDNLQFSGVYAYDDSTNDQTVVAVSRQMTRSQFNLLSAAEKKGLIQITDEYINESSGYSETTLWSGTELCNDGNAHELTLSDAYTNYDMFYILVKDPDNQIVIPLFITNAVELNQTYISAPWTNLGAFFVFTDTDTINVYRISYATNLTYLKVVGIKIGLSVGGGLPDYSTTEHKTGRKWIDGSTLYEKTFYIHDRQFNSSGECDFDVTSLNSDVLMADNMASYYTFSISSTEYTRQFEKLVPEEGHVYAYGPANRQIETGYITIKYTKSTT